MITKECFGYFIAFFCFFLIFKGFLHQWTFWLKSGGKQDSNKVSFSKKSKFEGACAFSR